MEKLWEVVLWRNGWYLNQFKLCFKILTTQNRRVNSTLKGKKQKWQLRISIIKQRLTGARTLVATSNSRNKPVTFQIVDPLPGNKPQADILKTRKIIMAKDRFLTKTPRFVIQRREIEVTVPRGTNNNNNSRIIDQPNLEAEIRRLISR